jgi:hypothetical protein
MLGFSSFEYPVPEKEADISPDFFGGALVPILINRLLLSALYEQAQLSTVGRLGLAFSG